MKVLRLVIIIILASRFLAAQSPDPSTSQSSPEMPTTHAQPPATGSISGHVFLGDSHLPARMAYVMLLPAGSVDVDDKKPVVSSGTVQSGLDGAYVMPNVLPGAYYVVAGKLGYATTIPISYLDPDGYEKAPREVKQALSTALIPTSVAANRTSRADIVLDRGAVISGVVRFDDGEADSMARVSLLQKEKSGKWTEFTAWEDLLSISDGGGASTDDQGNFRITGLPPGEYLLRTTLALQGGRSQDTRRRPHSDSGLPLGYLLRPWHPPQRREDHQAQRRRAVDWQHHRNPSRQTALHLRHRNQHGDQQPHQLRAG